MTLLLPGVCVTYLGDEIGMKNTWVSWEDTVDPQGLNVGIKEYENYSRDPERTPFQWDNSTSAGKSNTDKKILLNQQTWWLRGATLICCQVNTMLLSEPVTLQFWWFNKLFFQWRYNTIMFIFESFETYKTSEYITIYRRILHEPKNMVTSEFRLPMVKSCSWKSFEWLILQNVQGYFCVEKVAGSSKGWSRY